MSLREAIADITSPWNVGKVQRRFELERADKIMAILPDYEAENKVLKDQLNEMEQELEISEQEGCDADTEIMKLQAENKRLRDALGNARDALIHKKPPVVLYSFEDGVRIDLIRSIDEALEVKP